MTEDTIIRIFVEQHGHLESIGEDYGPEFFGGAIPEAGDVICSPGVLQGADRYDPANYTLHEVKRRFFIVQSFEPKWSLIGLVVQSRPGEESERSLLGI